MAVFGIVPMLFCTPTHEVDMSIFAVPRSLTKGLTDEAPYEAFTQAALEACENPECQTGFAVLATQAPGSIAVLREASSGNLDAFVIRGALKDLDTARLEALRAAAATSRTYARCQHFLDDMSTRALKTPLKVTATDPDASVHKFDAMYAIELLGLQALEGENSEWFEPGINPAKGLSPDKPIDRLVAAAVSVVQDSAYAEARAVLDELASGALHSLRKAAKGRVTDPTTLFASLQTLYSAQLESMRRQILDSEKFNSYRDACPLDLSVITETVKLEERDWHEPLRQIARWLNQQPGSNHLQPAQQVFHIAPRYTMDMPDDTSEERSAALAQRALRDPRSFKGMRILRKHYDRLYAYIESPEDYVPHNVRVALKRLESINVELLRKRVIESVEFAALSDRLDPEVLDLLDININFSDFSYETKEQIKMILAVARWINEAYAL
jgi:hypothetical protein